MNIRRPQDVPVAEHYAVLVFSSESRTRTEEPYTLGRGVGTYTETIEKVEYYAFTSEASLCEWLKNVKLEGLSGGRRVILKVAGQLSEVVKIEVKVK